NVGTIFKLTTAGAYTVLKHFNMDTTGGNPYGSLIIAPINNLVANPQSVTTAEDVKKVITLTGAGGNPLTFNIATSPKHGKITGTGANKTYTPTANYNGSDQFTFTASVGCLTSAPATVSITVTPVADSPVLATIGNKTVVKNATLSFTATATDADKGQTLAYSLIGAPAGASINSTTGAFTWTPATAGSYTFTLRVTDNGAPALYDEEQITVTVTNTFTANAQTSSDAAAKSFDAQIYPNPVSRTFNLVIKNSAEHTSASVADAMGNVVKVLTIQAGKNLVQVDVSELKAGTYFLKLQTGTTNKTISFIKL
ncbi:MAG TPA: Ig-like domain-containing protein, partial [Chitinophagaceae bacterium]|nr:Ig-like domain-containing protein [Chitinophagaceae bacterium]